MVSPTSLCQPWGERLIGTFLVGVMGLIPSPDSVQHELSARAAAGLSLLVCAPVSACAHALRACRRLGAHTCLRHLSLCTCLSPNCDTALPYAHELMQLNWLDVLKP